MPSLVDQAWPGSLDVSLAVPAHWGVTATGTPATGHRQIARSGGIKKYLATRDQA